MRRFNYRWVLLFLTCFSGFVFSAATEITYYYASGTVNGQLKTTANFASYPAACVSMAGLANMPYESSASGTTAGACYGTYGGQRYQTGLWRRVTQQCPNGNTGLSCNPEPQPDPCASKSGTPQEFTKSGSSGDGYGTVSGGYVAGVQSACFGGCAVNTSDQKCTGTVSGLYTCRGTAYHSGQSCSTTGTGTEIQDNAAQEPRPDPQVITEDKPCVYSGTGDTQTCISSKGEEKEGQYCGTVNGVKTCVDSKPTKNGIEIQTTFKTETQPDGSKTTTKTDVATKTTCTGAGQCSSTSTTTTTTTKTDGSGKTTSVTGSCTGEACPDKNANPDADGDGFGDCIGDDCGDGEGGGANDWYEPGDDTYASVIGDFADAVSDIPVVAGVDNFLTFTPSGACPVYSVDAWVFNIRLDQWCTGSTIPWELIKAVILACCAFVAFRIAFM